MRSVSFSSIYYPSYYRPERNQGLYHPQPSQTAFLDGLNKKRKGLAKLVTTPRFYALIGCANLVGLTVSYFTKLNIGKMMAAINATLYLTNAALQD